MKKVQGKIVFVVKENKVLLAKKTRVLGIGKWNGYGGGFDPEKDRNFLDCAVREFGEEAGGATIKHEDLEQIAHITFHNGNKFEFTAFIALKFLKKRLSPSISRYLSDCGVSSPCS
jgi:ADP-ribose pyrophosphatase YjhB (NUDIX family)